MSDRAIAISGAGGFVGSALSRALVELGENVSELLGPTDAASPNAERVDLSALTGVGAGEAAETLGRWLDGTRALVHAAGPPSVAASYSDPVASVAAHVVGTASVIEAARSAGVERLVLISSAEVYGRQQHQPVPECAPLAPLSPYGAAKVGAEEVARAAHRCGWLDVTILRPFSVYGPGQASHSLLSELLSTARAGDPLRVRDPRPRRDYLWVDDLCGAVSAALAGDCERRGEPATYNVASGVGHSVGELATEVARCFGLPEEIGVTGATRPADIAELVGDTTAVREGLGLPEPVALHVGLQRMMEGTKA